MIYFVDGFQGVGKTTLIDLYCKNNPNIINYKFSFSDIFSKILKEKDIVGFQAGKDFSCISLLSKLSENINKNIIIDRGFISSCIYSLLMGRMSETEVDIYIQLISQYINDNMRFIIIKQSNRNGLERNHMDGFDTLEAKILESNKLNVINHIVEFFKKYNIPITIFNNDFNYSITDNYNNFVEVFR